MASFKRVTPPASEPVALAEVRAFLRISHEDDDALLARLAKGARERVEELTGLALMPQGWRMAADFSEGVVAGGWRGFALRRPPFLALTEVRVVKADETSVALPVGDVRVRSDAALVQLPMSYAAYAGARAWRPVEIVWQAGFADADAVPDALKIAVLLLTAQAWERQGGIGTPLGAMPPAVAAMLAPFREMRL
jgi:uncharacterized phiE125 gp8 family phage protein